MRWELFAIKNIEAGQQIYIQYNQVTKKLIMAGIKIIYFFSNETLVVKPGSKHFNPL